MKRRVIYMSDTEWSALREVARNHGQTVSECIRQQVGLLPSEAFHETALERTSRILGEGAAELENSLADVGHAVRNADHAFRTRPFTPVPKK